MRLQGRITPARRLFERALAIRESRPGGEHLDTLRSLRYLAVLLQEEGDVAGARPLLERAVAVSKRVLGPEHPWSVETLRSLAEVFAYESAGRTGHSPGDGGSAV
jgi:hypothetical protein